MQINVQHNPAEKKFYAVIDGAEARLLYQDMGNGILNYHSTRVPESLQGRGIALELVKFGLEYARQNRLKVNPGCSYVQKILERHPEQYADLLP